MKVVAAKSELRLGYVRELVRHSRLVMHSSCWAAVLNARGFEYELSDYDVGAPLDLYKSNIVIRDVIAAEVVT